MAHSGCPQKLAIEGDAAVIVSTTGVSRWAKTYRGSDVTILSVHTPETPAERSVAAARRFAGKHGLLFPVLVDNGAKTWNAYGIESWPTEVLIDKRGRVHNEYAGELNWQGSGEYKAVARKIEALRAEAQAARR